ncbi:hypothetical protein F0562_000922 [Nyssa sinensis]|uniref:Protein yippee-like n=1 Tax=Nyssa sinensis TaxID=561372 RepID=A0A5J5C1U5_9ASTE|nr:hypothetical protein F0562_000922 [Nyssa sinensis]
MGRRSLIEYDQTPDVHFFLCRQCRAHIALTQEFFFTDIMMNAGIFKNVVNVQVDGQAHNRTEGPNQVANAHCNRCNRLLGWKFVEVRNNTIIVKPGRFLLHLNKLLLWDGNQMLYSDTHQPVEIA